MLEPAFQKAVLAQLGTIGEDTQALRRGQDRAAAEQARQSVMLEELLRRTARPGAVTEAQLIGLAERIAGDVPDVEAAVYELERAVEIAERVQEEGRAGSNLGDFVDAVLQRMAELSAAGEHDAAAETDTALAREEAETKARQVRLLDAGLEQDILRRDAESAARRIARKAELELPEGGSLFAALRIIRRAWYEHGRDKGLKFDLEVAIALARLTHAQAADSDQRGMALNGLGNALKRIGQREAGTARQEAAVSAYRAALEELTRERVPLDWARTQMNLGNALQALGAREAGTTRLTEAVGAYRAALEDRSAAPSASEAVSRLSALQRPCAEGVREV